MLSRRKEYPLVEKSAELLGGNNGALNTKMKMREVGMTDDDAYNRSLQKHVQKRYKDLNSRNFPLSVNSLIAK